MPDPTWLLPARSIPVWVGARIIVPYLGGVVSAWCVEIANSRVICSDGYRWLQSEIAPDLSNPDTFAAARDRLAARMGLDPDLIADGVLFGPAQPGGKWLIGGLLGLRLTWTTTDVYANTRELALALAWQKVVES